MHVVTGGEHDAVQVVFDAVAGADADRAQCRDRPVDQLAVVALQGGVVVAGDQHAFAAGSEIGSQLAAQPRVFDLPAQMQAAQPGHQRRQRSVPHQSGGAGLMAPEQRLTRKLLNRRHFGEHRLHGGRSGDVPARQHPARGALKHLDELGLLDQFGDDLDGAGAGADDRDPLAGEVVVVVPAGTVDLVPAVGVDAADVGEAGVRQRPGRQDDGAGPKTLAGGRGCGPHAGVLVERQPGDLLAEPDVAADVEPGGHVLEVPADLVGRRVRSRPRRVLDERDTSTAATGCRSWRPDSWCRARFRPPGRCAPG